jgi:hypothetical protein
MIPQHGPDVYEDKAITTRKRRSQEAMDARQRYLATMDRIKANGGMPKRPCDTQPVDGTLQDMIDYAAELEDLRAGIEDEQWHARGEW